MLGLVRTPNPVFGSRRWQKTQCGHRRYIRQPTGISFGSTCAQLLAVRCSDECWLWLLLRLLLLPSLQQLLLMKRLMNWL